MEQFSADICHLEIVLLVFDATNSNKDSKTPYYECAHAQHMRPSLEAHICY